MLNSVMVIDDEASIRTAVEQWLSLSGFEVQVFARAEDGLVHIGRDYPGVIISDVRMPGMDGLQLLERLQADDPDLPVILLTGHGDVPMAVEAMRSGAYDFLEKPFTPSTCSSAFAGRWKNANWCWKIDACISRQTSGRALKPRCLGYHQACSSCAARYWIWPRCR